MKIKLFFLLFIIISVRVFSQSGYILGNVATENGDKLPNTNIYNLRTDQVVIADKMGNFAIAALPSDELRFVRQGYERRIIVLTTTDFSKSLDVKLTTIPQEIEEVKLAFIPTGILKKDIKRLNPSARVVELNDEVKRYMTLKPTEVYPKSSIPSSFKQPDLSAGQLNLVKLAGAAYGLVKKATESPKTTANYAETKEFYTRIKAVIDLGYYTKFGMDEYDFDIFLSYADKAYGISKNYRKNFNKAAIESQLKVAFVEYVKTHQFNSEKSGG